MFPVIINHYNIVVSRHLKSPVTRLFGQQLIQVNKKECIKSLHHWPFGWGIHRSPMDSPHKGSVIQKAFPYPDPIMILGEELDSAHRQPSCCFAIISGWNKEINFPGNSTRHCKWIACLLQYKNSWAPFQYKDGVSYGTSFVSSK